MVLEGDETGQELLEEALRVYTGDGLVHFIGRRTIRPEGDRNNRSPAAYIPAGEQADPNRKIELQIFWWGGPARAENTQKVLDLYKKKHPNVTINAIRELNERDRLTDEAHIVRSEDRPLRHARAHAVLALHLLEKAASNSHRKRNCGRRVWTWHAEGGLGPRDAVA